MMLTSLGQLDKSRRYTYTDYLNWNFPQRVELILGKVFPMAPAPLVSHQHMLVRLCNRFFNHFHHSPCNLLVAPVDVVLPGPDGEADTVLQPDLIVVCDLTKLTKRNCTGAPDLVVEIISKSTAHRDRNEKFKLYEHHGVKEYWIVDAYTQTVEVFVRDPNGSFILGMKALHGETVSSRCFPGLEVETGDVFNWIVEEPRLMYGAMRRKDERIRGRRMVRL
ncbi:MAG: Uma2 family endonuclease [Bacteroidota bacterium]